MQPGRIDTVFSFFEYFFTRLRTKHAVSSSLPPSRREVRFEVLEPRLLLSADPVIPLAADLAADQAQQEDQAGILSSQQASPGDQLLVELADRVFLSFDGDHRVEVTPTADNETLALTGSSTVEIRFRYDTPAGDEPKFMPLVYKAQQDEGGDWIRTYSLWINDASGQLLLTTTDARDEQIFLSAVEEVGETVSPGEDWHDLATVIDRVNGTIKVYLDGSELGLQGNTVRTDAALATDEPLLIGATNEQGNDISQGFLGDIDQVAIWYDDPATLDIDEGVRGPQQIFEDFGSIDVTSAGLAAYWTFNEKQGTTVARDSSPKRNDGVLGGDERKMRTVEPADPDVKEGDTVHVEPVVVAAPDAVLMYLWQVEADNHQDIPGGTAPTFSFVPFDDGLYTVRLAVTDTVSGLTAHPDEIVISSRNVAPNVISDRPHRTAVEGDEVELTDDGAKPLFKVAFSDAGSLDTPHTVTIDWGDNTSSFFPEAVAGKIFDRHVYDEHGEYEVEITIEDDDGGVGVGFLNVTVSAVNDAPVLATIGNWVVDEGQLLSFSATATDADVPANVLTFSLDEGAPAGAAIDPTTGAFTWMPSEAQGPGAYPVTVRVTDGALDDSEPITITVNEVNLAPVLALIGNRAVNEGETLNFSAGATDADVPANVLTFSLDAGAPAGAAIDPTLGVFTWTPSEAQGPGAYPVTVRVTDNGEPLLNDFETITITVNEANVAPVLALIGNRAVNEGETLNFSASATDADVPANALTFSLDAGAPAGAAIDPTLGVFTWTPSEAQGPGAYPVTVRVTDNGEPLLNDFETITITVNEVNLAPVLDPLSNWVVDEEEQTVSFTATATDPDVPANALTFSLMGAPDGAAIDAISGLFSWTPSEVQGQGSYTFDVVVTDDGVEPRSDSETITVTVNEKNLAPLLAAIGNRTVKEQTELSFTATATDADVPANALTFSLDAGAPAGAAIDPTTGVFTWTPSEAQGPGAYPVTVRVTDNGEPLLNDFETITITVNEANVAPIAYWSLNETSGKTIKDTAGTPQNGRFFASRPDLDDAGPPAPFGAQTGADFHNTTSEYIAVANDPAFQVAEGSIQLWFETDDAWDKQTLFAKDRSGTGSGQLKIWLDDRDLKVKLEDGCTTWIIDTDDTAFNNPVRSNEWYQLTFTFGLGGMKLYLDDILIGSNSYIGGLTNNVQPIVIGGSNASNQDDCDDLSRLRITDPFDGHIDEVAFFGMALTAEQIEQSRQQGAMGVGKDVLISAGNVALVEAQPAPAPAHLNTLSQPAPVTIDWTGRAAPASTALHRTAKWVADFVNDLGSSDGERNPNDKLRLKLPAKIAAVLSKCV